MNSTKESKWWCTAYGEPTGQTAPDCPVCSKPVRQHKAERTSYFGTLANSPPWNAGWDGYCNACGHRFEKVVEKEIYRMAQKSGKRKIAFRPSAIPYRTFIDSAVVLRGIEIVIEDEPLGMTPRKTSLTLTIEELEILFKSLNGELSICKQQYSWEEDWT